MSAPNPEQQRSARQLLGLNGERRSALQCAEAAKHLGEQLRLGLAPLIGSGGFDTLFARSVHLATASLTPQQELSSFLAEQDALVATDIATAVFANFFALMTTFIGEKLTEKVLLKIGLPVTVGPHRKERDHE